MRVLGFQSVGVPLLTSTHTHTHTHTRTHTHTYTHTYIHTHVQNAASAHSFFLLSFLPSFLSLFVPLGAHLRPQELLGIKFVSSDNLDWYNMVQKYNETHVLMFAPEPKLQSFALGPLAA